MLSLESVVMTSLNAVVEPAVFALASLASLALALGISSAGVLAAAGVLLVLWWRAAQLNGSTNSSTTQPSLSPRR